MWHLFRNYGTWRFAVSCSSQNGGAAYARVRWTSACYGLEDCQYKQTLNQISILPSLWLGHMGSLSTMPSILNWLKDVKLRSPHWILRLVGLPLLKG